MNLKIGATSYKVFFDPDPISEDTSHVSGSISFRESTIKVDSTMSKQRQYQTLVHEVFHGILNNFDVEDDEHITTKLANGIYGFIVDNADFVKEILKNDKKIKA